MKRTLLPRRYKVISILLLVLMSLSACSNPVAASEGAPPANCVYIVGDSKGGDDGNIHDVVYPNDDNYTVDDGEDSWFVYCNGRNFLFNNGDEYYLDGIRIGDYHKPLLVTSQSGVNFFITGGIYWMLNQDRAAMEDFWEQCLKYTCASPEAYDPAAQNQNFATVGWSGFIVENFTYAILGAANKGMLHVSDDIWYKNSLEQIELLEDQISTNFAAELRTTLGFDTDIICGSHTSGWQHPDRPGEGDDNKFICADIRVDITSVMVAPDEYQTPAGRLVLNQMNYDSAHILYGENTEEVLGNLNTVEACVQAGANCTVVVGDTGKVGVSIPNTQANPVPTEEATKPEG